MKKICFILLMIISAVLFVVSCGDDPALPSNNDTESEENTVMGELDGKCYPNRTCNDGLVCDTEKNICIEEPDDPEEEPVDDTDEEPVDDADDVDCDDCEEDSDTVADAETMMGGLDGECYPNKTCNEGLICDTEQNICIEKPDDGFNPCESDPNPCSDAEHSTGICTHSTDHEEGFYCDCADDFLGSYQWYKGQCRRVVSKHRCEQLATLAEQSFPIPDWASTALEFVCYCFSPDTCLALWEP